jgi:hypothetical protein
LLVGLSACHASAPSAQGSGKETRTSADGAIKVMTIGSWSQPLMGTANPEFPGGAQAAAAAINAAGGINGHPVEVIVCSDELNPEVARKCAREAAQQHVAAIVGLQTFNETTVLPVLEASGIPVVGIFPFTKAALTSRVSFPFTSGFIGQTIGMGLQLARSGAREVRVIVPGGMGSISSEIGASVALGAEAGNARYAGLFQIPAKSLDLSPVVAAATGGGASVAGLAVDEAELIRSMRSLAPGAMMSTYAFNLSDNVLRSAGAASDGIMAVEAFVPPTSDTVGARSYRRDLAAFNPALPISATGLHEWLAMMTFARVAQGLPQVTAASMMEAMGRVRNLDMAGITPPYSTTPRDPSLPRLFNATIVFETVQSGRIVQQASGTSPFVNIGPLIARRMSQSDDRRP